jgi:hypothetical protein
LKVLRHGTNSNFRSLNGNENQKKVEEGGKSVHRKLANELTL